MAISFDSLLLLIDLAHITITPTFLFVFYTKNVIDGFQCGSDFNDVQILVLYILDLNLLCDIPFRLARYMDFATDGQLSQSNFGHSELDIPIYFFIN